MKRIAIIIIILVVFVLLSGCMARTEVKPNTVPVAQEIHTVVGKGIGNVGGGEYEYYIQPDNYYSNQIYLIKGDYDRVRVGYTYIFDVYPNDYTGGAYRIAGNYSETNPNFKVSTAYEECRMVGKVRHCEWYD